MKRRVSDEAPLRVALVGAGSMGALHARVVTQAHGATLACIVDPDPATGEALAARFDTVWRPALDDFSGIHAVIVASPTGTHARIAEMVLDAERPLLVEKPLSQDLVEVRAMIDTSARRGVPLMCGFVERYNPAVLAALEIVCDPAYLTFVRHSPYAPRVKTGVAQDLLIHDVDLALGFTKARPVRVQAMMGSFHPSSLASAEDVAELHLRFDSGMLATLSASRIAQRKVRMVTISDVERLVELDLLRQDITVYRHVGNAPLDTDGLGYRQQTVIDIPFIPRGGEPLALQFQRFVDLARGNQDADEERRTLLGPHRVIDAAMRSGGDSPVTLHD